VHGRPGYAFKKKDKKGGIKSARGNGDLGISEIADRMSGTKQLTY